jgi:hypothetical protein
MIDVLDAEIELVVVMLGVAAILGDPSALGTVQYRAFEERQHPIVQNVRRGVPAHSFPSDAICKRRPVGYAGLWFRGNFALGWFTDLPD